jgi:hypothetical protein
MKPDEQRIAIAEACGAIWMVLEGKHPFKYRMLTMCFNPDYYERASGEEAVCNPIYMWSHGKIPDYLNDLNAMHEVEKVLGSGQWPIYARNVARACNWVFCEDWTDAGIILHATAAQRAEAFLRVIGKWKDQP